MRALGNALCVMALLATANPVGATPDNSGKVPLDSSPYDCTGVVRQQGMWRR